MRGNVKADFLAVEDRRSEFAAHQISQDHFLPGALDFQVRRERACKLHDAMIEERRAHFHRMSHAGVVHLRQDVIRKKVFLIEPQKGRQIVASRGQFPQDGIERRWQRPDCSSERLFLVVERSAPVHVGARRRASGSLPGSASACIRIRSCRSTPASVAAARHASPRSSGGGNRRAVRASKLARCIRYPPNNSSAPSPLSATVALVFVNRERNHTGKCAGIRVRLVAIISELVNRARQILFRH